MSSSPTASVDAVQAHYAPNQFVSVARLIERIRNDTFETNPGSRGETDLAYRRGHNAAMNHVETAIIPYLIACARIDACLDELEEATRG